MEEQGISQDRCDEDLAYKDAIKAALGVLWVRSAPDARLVGSGATGTIFKRTRSRPVRKLAATPLQSYVWLLAQKPTALNDLIDTVRARITAVSHRDVAWVITDLIRDGYLQSGLDAEKFGPVE